MVAQLKKPIGGTRMRAFLEEPLGYVDGANRYQVELSNPINRVDPMGLFVELYVGGEGTWSYHDQEVRDPASKVGYINCDQYHKDLNELLAGIKANVAARGGGLIQITFTAHGVVDKECKPGALMEHHRILYLLKTSVGPPKGTPLDSEFSLEFDDGKLSDATAYFFTELAKLAPPGCGLNVILYACNTGHGKDGADFLQAIANITNGKVTGYDGEVNDEHFKTNKPAITKLPAPPDPTVGGPPDFERVPDRSGPADFERNAGQPVPDRSGPPDFER